MTSVQIIEVGPRDGLQNESVPLSTQQKLDLISKLNEAGLSTQEVTSFVHPKLVPQMADAESVMAGLSPRPKHVIGLVLNKKGAERALAAGVDELGFTMSATDSFGTKNQGMTRAEGLAAWRETLALAQAAGKPASCMISVVWHCPFEGKVNRAQVLDIVKDIASTGPHVIGLADTIGAAAPAEVESLIEEVRKIAPNNPIRVHFHNTRGTALANAQAAYNKGVRLFDSSAGGIGGCPFAPNATGNVPTEDLAYMFERMGISTGVDLPKLITTVDWLSKQLGKPLPGLVSRAGLPK